MSGASRYASKMRSQRRMAGKTVEDRMQMVIESLADFTSAWDVIGEVWSEREQTIFRTQSYNRWAPLDASTMRDKHGVSDRPLIRTGQLFRALTNPNPRAMGPRFAVYGPPTSTDGDVISYGTRHARGSARMPRRNPVPMLTPTERRNMIDIMRWHLLPEDMRGSKPVADRSKENAIAFKAIL